jgi:hypothetical protein
MRVRCSSDCDLCARKLFELSRIRVRAGMPDDKHDATASGNWSVKERAFDAWQTWRLDGSPRGAVRAAILAASPHNTQPWTFEVCSDSIKLFADPDRRIGTLDALDREYHVGLGCALENLDLGLRARGYRPTVTVLPDRTNRSHIATVTSIGGGDQKSPLYDAIGSRHSNRGPYTSQPVRPEVVTSLGSTTSGLDGAIVRWFTTDDERTALGSLIVQASIAIVNDGQQSRDSYAWFRRDQADINRASDGMTLAAQGLSPVMLAATSVFPAASRTAGDTFWLEQTRAVQTSTAAAYGVVAVKNPRNIVQRVIGGRLLQRIHLAATLEGVGLQHMNQVTERIDRDASIGRTSQFSSDMELLLAQPGYQTLATFRIGYPVHASSPSPRRSFADVIRR